LNNGKEMKNNEIRAAVRLFVEELKDTKII
jgi:hypothetical protein